MKLTSFFGAVAACGLIAGAAYAQAGAQSGAPTDTTSGAAGSVAAPGTPGAGMSGSMSGSASTGSASTPGANTSDQAPADTTAAPGATSATGVSATSATTYGQAASVTTTTTTNGPVPDTAENRQKYGGPMSRAGRHSAAKGN